MLLRTLLISIKTKVDDAGTKAATKSTDGFKKGAVEAGKAAKGLGTESTKAAKGVTSVGSSSSSAGGKVRGLGGMFKSAAKSAGVLAGAVVAAGAALVAGALVKGISFVADETARLDKIAKGAQKSGLGVDAYQRLDHVATLSGTNIEALSKATLKLGLNLDDVAAGGGKAAAEALGKVGLSANSLRGKSATEQLGIVSDALSKIDDEGERARIAFDLFGKSGTELLPLLNSGSAAIDKMSASVGRVFTRDELAKAEAYQDAMANLKRGVGTVAGEFALELAPIVTKFVDQATDFLPKVSEALEPIKQATANVTAEDIAGWMDTAIKTGEGLIKTASTIASVFTGLISTFGETEHGAQLVVTSMAAIGLAITGPAGLVVAAGLLGVSFGSAIADMLHDFDGLNDKIAETEGRISRLQASISKSEAAIEKAETATEAASAAAEQRTQANVARGVAQIQADIGGLGKGLVKAGGVTEGDAIFLGGQISRGGEQREAAREAVLTPEGRRVQAAVDKANRERFAAIEKRAREEAKRAGTDADAATQAARDAYFASAQERRQKAFAAATAEFGATGSTEAAIAAAEKALRDAGGSRAKRGGRGGGGRAQAATPAAEKPRDILAQLGLTGPESVLANRPAPQTLTIYISPIIKMIETMTITIPPGTPEAQATALRSAATQAADALTSTLGDVQRKVEEMFGLEAKALATVHAGGSTPRGVM